MNFWDKYSHCIFVSCNFSQDFVFRNVQPSILIRRILKKSLFEVDSGPESDDSCAKKDGFA